MRLSNLLGCVALVALTNATAPCLGEEKTAATEAPDVRITVVTGIETTGEAASDTGAGDTGAGEAEGCVESGKCADAEACENDDSQTVAAQAPGKAKPAGDSPTHKQTKLIEVNKDDLAKASLRSFCLTPEGTILAACGASPGEVRLLSPTGEYLASWELPFDPEAINIGSDGAVYVAGAGRLVRMSPEGEVLLEADSPHVEMTDEKRQRIRESIVEQQKKTAERYAEMVAQHQEKYALLKNAAEVFKSNRINLTGEQKQRVNQAKRLVDQWERIRDQVGGKDLTEEQLDQRVEASIKSLSAVSSISESGGEVFLATREETGYAYCVWRLSSDFTGGEVIAGGLRGCCGQMDVQCCENGLYVAENSRHRVYHLSRSGEELGQWGRANREGLEGFGSCCNPMNVAFGPARSVYTAESGAGRIKRYSPEGELIELVGSVDVVPGCKKVSIAVGPSGDRVYMMDITRNHIVLMERKAAGEEASSAEARAEDADEVPLAAKVSLAQPFAGANEAEPDASDR